MLYSTGTIAISGNTVTGTGTNFQAAGSLIRTGCTLLSLGATIQAFQITAINSATSLTVTPAASPALAAGTKYAILVTDSISVDGLANDVAYSLDLFNKNMGGFADLVNGVGDVTITINGTAVTVPGQKSLAKKGANSDITSLSGMTTALSVSQGGTGGKNAADARANLGISDQQLNSLNGKSGGTVNSDIRVVGGQSIGVSTTGGGNKDIYLVNVTGDSVPEGNFVNFLRGYWYSANWVLGGVRGGSTDLNRVQLSVSTGSGQGADFSFFPDGRAVGNWQSASDERIKDIHGRIENPLEKMRQIRGLYWTRLDTGSTGYGFTAQDVQGVFPDAVVDTGMTITLTDGTKVKDVLSPDTFGVAAALHHEAMLALMDQRDAADAKINNLEAELAALKEQVNQLLAK